MTDKTVQPIGRMMLKDARLAFPNLFEPSAIVGADGKPGKPRYGATLIVGADHPQLAQINKVIAAVAQDKWKDKAKAQLTALEKQDKLALHEGDLKPNYDGFPGNWFVSANSQENAPPTVVDVDKGPLTARSGKPYAGCYVNASLEFWAQDNNYGKRINCTLRGIQFLRDGDAFSAARPADSDEFDDVTEGSDAADFA